MICRPAGVRPAPDDLAFVQIDGRDPAVWRLEGGQSHHPGRIFTRASRVAQVRALLVADGDVGDEGRRDRRDEEHPGFGVEARALPVAAANRSWQLDGP